MSNLCMSLQKWNNICYGVKELSEPVGTNPVLLKLNYELSFLEAIKNKLVVLGYEERYIRDKSNTNAEKIEEIFQSIQDHINFLYALSKSEKEAMQ